MVDWWRYLISHIIPHRLISFHIKNTPSKTSSHPHTILVADPTSSKGFSIYPSMVLFFMGLNPETAPAHAMMRLHIIFSYPPP